MKTVRFLAVAVLTLSVLSSSAQDRRRSGRGRDRDGGKDRIVSVEHMPKPSATLVAVPDFVNNPQGMMPKVSKKPRRWGLFELKYMTYEEWTSELTFTWHVLVKANPSDLKKAEAKAKNNPGESAEVSPYSYFTVTVKYVNIPRGAHMACTAIPPSIIERYGEPKVISVDITDQGGQTLAGKTESLIGGMEGRWWEDEQVMNNPKPAARVARRNGLVDRSETPFALINSSDYETISK